MCSAATWSGCCRARRTIKPFSNSPQNGAAGQLLEGNEGAPAPFPG